MVQKGDLDAATIISAAKIDGPATLEGVRPIGQ
jgi:hypothetical protein